ncbi:hypothetical protein C8J57DRAFT_1337253 [Mycena rebaudengoi]|nr:hypothetical protein C8J57DRAFT_1337253 [Mycena rebaudengoi]
MHPSLELQNLSQLTPSDKRLAMSAAKGSLNALHAVVNLLSTDYSHPGLFAPVFFANLDPSAIQNMDLMKPCPPAIKSYVPRVMLSLKALSIRKADGEIAVLVAEAFGDIWPRTWKWIQLLECYRADLVDVIALSDVDSYSIYCAIILRLYDHKQSKELLYATPGVRDVMTRAWTVFLANQTTPKLDLLGICRFMVADVITPKNLQGLLLGAGGDFPDLAKLLAGHLNFVIPVPDHPISDDTLLLLSAAVRLLKSINHRNEEWSSELLSQGIVQPLVVTMRSLAVSAKGAAHEMLDDCFVILTRLLIFTPRHQYLVEALKAGLLHAIVLCRVESLSIKCFLTAILPPSTVYYTVLKQLVAALPEVASITQTSQFELSEIFPNWKKFMEVTESRFHVMRRYDGGDWLSGRYCDNLNCAKRMKPADQRRCSGCGTSYYCSKECQIIDWKIGGHRKVCKRFGELVLSDPEMVNTRDRSFIWALAHLDWMTNKPNLYIQRISAMNNHRDYAIFSVLDYIGGIVKVSVRLTKSMGVNIPSFREPWDEAVARAARSGGRIHVVALLLPEGKETRYRFMTMQSQTSVINDGLEDIAKSLPQGLEDIRDPVYGPIMARRLTALLEKDGCDVSEQEWAIYDDED